MGVVTWQAKYASFYSSLTGMVECILQVVITYKFSAYTITSFTIAQGNNGMHTRSKQKTAVQSECVAVLATVGDASQVEGAPPGVTSFTCQHDSTQFTDLTMTVMIN